MKRILRVTLLMILLSLMLGNVHRAVDASGSAYFEQPLCLPGMPDDGTCLMLGPAQVIAELKAAGFTYPPRGLPAATPPSEMGSCLCLSPRSIFPKTNLPQFTPVLKTPEPERTRSALSKPVGCVLSAILNAETMSMEPIMLSWLQANGLALPQQHTRDFRG